MPALEFLAYALTRLGNAQVPAEIAAGLALARLTALQKPGRGVCGIATGDVFRRLVSDALAKGWADTFDHTTRPYQFALQTRAGADALAARARAALESQLDAVLVSLDGRSAYDSMSRASSASCSLARPNCSVPCAYFMEALRRIVGGEQMGAAGRGLRTGRPTAPALFAVERRCILCNAASTLHPAYSLVAFPDDLYVITTQDRARESRDTVVGTVERGCGIA